MQDINTLCRGKSAPRRGATRLAPREAKPKRGVVNGANDLETGLEEGEHGITALQL